MVIPFLIGLMVGKKSADKKFKKVNDDLDKQFDKAMKDLEQ